MPRGRTVSFVKIFLASVAAIALFATVALLFGVKSAEAVTYAEEDGTEIELKEYEFSSDSVVCVRSATGAAIYFTGEADDSLKFKCVFPDESEKVQKSPYFFGLTDDVKIFVVRDEDGEYAAFEREIDQISVEGPLVRLADGQKSAYSGKAPSGTSETYEKVPLALETEDGNVSFEVKDVGKYCVLLAYATSEDEEVQIRAPYRIVPLEITVRPTTLTRAYDERSFGKVTKKIVVDKTLLAEDETYIQENTSVTVDEGITSATPVGEYEAIYADYFGDSPNFIVNIEVGTCRITAGTLRGFKLADMEIKYDGKAHRRPEVVYDKEQWPDVTVKYSFDEVTAVGVYTLTAVVSLENYTSVTLRSEVVIKGEYLESSSMTDYVKLSGNESGYRQDMRIYLTESELKGLEQAVEKELIKNERTAEKIAASYDVMVEFRGITSFLVGETYDLTIKVNGLNTASGVRVLQYDGNAVKELEYTFRNGCFVMTTDSTQGIVFVKSESVARSTAATVIPAALIGGAVVIAVCAVLAVLFVTSRKERRRSRRRHSRWA